MSLCSPMAGRQFLLLPFIAILCAGLPSFGQQRHWKVVAFYSENSEPDHVDFARDAVKFLTQRAASEHFTFEATTKWEDLNDEHLKAYQLVIWLNDTPTDAGQRKAFE